MRLGQVPDANELAIETRTGNTLLFAHGLLGDTCCVGVCDLNDKSGILFALWNSGGNHGIYVFKTGNVGLVKQSSAFNFRQDVFPDLADYVVDYSVSMQEINGLLFFQDEYNQPRVLQWEKFKAGYFNSDLDLEWELTRIRRKPASLLVIEFNDTDTDPEGLAAATETAFPNVPERGNQWAYSYLYDDFSESRLSPFSPVIWSTDVDFFVPAAEADLYLRIDADTPNNLIQAVKFYFRRGNTGPWLFYQKVDNTEANYVNKGGVKTIEINVPSQLTVTGAAPVFDVSALVADAVPLQVRDSKLSQNRLFDANFIEDRDPWEDLDFTITEVTNEPLVDGLAQFHPECTYLVGVNLIDLWGRRIGVTKTKTYMASAQVDAANPGRTYVARDNNANEVFLTNDTTNGARSIQINFTGTLPDWCEYVEIAVTPNQSLTSFFRTHALLWQWVTVSEQNGFGNGFLTSTMDPAADTNKQGVFKGIAFDINSGEGFDWSENEETYVRILGVDVFGSESDSYLGQLTGNLGDLSDPQYAVPFPVYFKVVGQQGNRILCQTTEEQFNAFGQATRNIPEGTQSFPSAFARWYIEVVTKATAPEKIFYTSLVIGAADIPDENPFTVTGDVFYKNQNRTYSGGQLGAMLALDRINPDRGNFDTTTFTVGSFETDMNSISPSRVNPWATFWDYNQGTGNLENPDQRQIVKFGYIRPSGQFILGTQINRLNTSNPGDEIPMPSELGAINGLMLVNSSQALNTVMLAWCNNGVATNYLSQAQFVDSSQGSLNLDTTRVIGTTRTLVGNYGTNRLKHLVASTKGRGYAYSSNFRDIIRYSQDGLTRLGDVFGFYLAIRDSDSQDLACMGFDPYYDEVLYSGGTENGIAFNDKADSFQGNIPTPFLDRFWTLRDFDLLSFKEGNLYIHSYTNDSNEWYGRRQDSSLTLIANAEPTQIKRWRFMGIDGDLSGPITLTTDTGQETTLTTAEFVDRMGYYQASIKSDENSTGGKYNGEPLASKILTVEITISTTSGKKVFNFFEIAATLNRLQ